MSKPNSEAARAKGRGQPRNNSGPPTAYSPQGPPDSDSPSSFVTLGSNSDSEPDSQTGGPTPRRSARGAATGRDSRSNSSSISSGISTSSSSNNSKSYNGNGSSAVSPATRQCPICPASFPNDLALGIHQRTHQPSHSHNDDAATVPPTPASPHGIVPETQQFPTSVDGAACPFSSLLPCEFAHQPHTQLQRWVEHVNGHAGPQGVGDDLWFDFVHEALTRRQLLSSVSFCPCGRFVPNTEYGKLRHGRVCKVMFRDLSDVRGSSLPEEFRSLSVRAFGATMDNGRIACGRFALSIIDHGAKAGRHRNACFYLAPAEITARPWRSSPVLSGAPTGWRGSAGE